MSDVEHGFRSPISNFVVGFPGFHFENVKIVSQISIFASKSQIFHRKIANIFRKLGCQDSEEAEMSEMNNTSCPTESVVEEKFYDFGASKLFFDKKFTI